MERIGEAEEMTLWGGGVFDAPLMLTEGDTKSAPASSPIERRANAALLSDDGCASLVILNDGN